MASCFLFVLSLIIVSTTAQSRNEVCDFQFGNPDWGQSEVVYDLTAWYPRGEDKLINYLPKDRGMISFICVNISGINKKLVTVQYSPLFHKLIINLAMPAPWRFLYHVTAKAHGY